LFVEKKGGEKSAKKKLTRQKGGGVKEEKKRGWGAKAAKRGRLRKKTKSLTADIKQA